jgi:alkylhydroperoxidase family enzyme
LRAHFKDKEIGALTSAIALINFWNRVQISRH